MSDPLTQSSSWWTLIRGRWHSLYPEWQLQLFLWQGQASQESTGRNSQTDCQMLGQRPLPSSLPFLSSLCIFPDEGCKPTVYMPMVLGQAQPLSLLETWSQHERGEAEGKGGRARTVVDRVWAARGTPRSLLPKLNSVYSVSLEFLFSFSCSPTVGQALDI